MRSNLLCAILLLAPFLTGCVRTIQPILKDEQVAPIDQDLIGKWVSEAGSETADIRPSGKPATYTAEYTDKDGKKGTLLVRLGKVGDLNIAELRADDPAPDANDVFKYHLLPVYSFLRIHQTRPRLLFSTMKQDWLKTYLDAHPNELQFFKRDDALIITSSTDDFQAFLLRHYKDEGAMTDQQAFVRPGDPTTQPAKAGR